jgi:3-methyladenine DNA glycosylase AlkD
MEVADLVRDSIAALESHADPKRAAGQRRYFKEQVEFLGLTSPQIREIGVEIWGRVRKTWGFSDAVAYAEAMLSREFYEIRTLGLLVVLRFRKDFPPSFMDHVRGWLAANRLDNWALVDVFCVDALGFLLEKHPELIAKIKTWPGDPNRWVKRASAVSFINPARRGRCLDTIYDIAVKLFPVQDDLIHKATGWLLREAGKTDRPRLRSFLLKYGPEIPRTTLRYAIEHFPEAERKILLTRTKAVKP